MLDAFIKEVASSANPLRYGELTSQPKPTQFILKVVLICIFVATVISIPDALDVPSYISKELSKISVHKSDVNITTETPIVFPTKNPFIVVDLQERKQIGKEHYLFTPNKLIFRTWKETKEITYEEMKNIKENNKTLTQLILSLIIILLPMIIVTIIALIFLKYYLISWILGLFTFLLLDLTSYRIPFHRAFGTSGYATIILIPLEILWLPFDTSYLIPIGNILRIPFYFIPILLYLVYYLLCLFVTVLKYREKRKIILGKEEW
jgi:hypothetical protein